jgi:hypothetical protein
MAGKEDLKKYGLSSRILESIREEVSAVRRGSGPASSDYYAKQANPKDGGYAKSNYVKGDGFRVLAGDIREKQELSIRARPNVSRRKQR